MIIKNWFRPMLAVIALAFATSVAAVEETPTTIPGGTYVTAAQAKAQFDKGAVFIDSRVAAECAESKIKGALCVVYKEKHGRVSTVAPEDTMDLGKLPQDKAKALVFYCNGSPCWRGYKGAVHAIKAGYKNVFWFRDGLPAWKTAGHPTE